MTPEQKAVILDAAQEMQHNDKWWREFEYESINAGWCECTKDFNPLRHVSITNFRRRPKTITVTMPLPELAIKSHENHDSLYVVYKNEKAANTALAAIREAVK